MKPLRFFWHCACAIYWRRMIAHMSIHHPHPGFILAKFYIHKDAMRRLAI